MAFTNEMYIFGIVVFAALLGGVVGYERERLRKPAGLRTHMLLCAAAALLTQMGDIIIWHYTALPTDIITADPMRILNAIIVGVSFIGGGVIIYNAKTNSVQHLTTATSLLLVASIGMVVGLQLYYLATAVTLLALVVNFVLGRMEVTMKTKLFNKEDNDD